MKLVDNHKLNIHNPLRNYISGILGTDKTQLVVQDIMAHHGRLIPWIGFHQNTTLPNKKFGYNPTYYSGLLQEKYNIPVAKGMFMRSDYKDSIYQIIWNSPLREKIIINTAIWAFILCKKSWKDNLVSLWMNTFLKVSINHLVLDIQASDHYFTHPAGNIAPTEIDNYFRLQTLQGNVHDIGAAMMGGVAGHAGLFRMPAIWQY